MGYYIDGSSNYYEGDKRSPSDTAVTQDLFTHAHGAAHRGRMI